MTDDNKSAEASLSLEERQLLNESTMLGEGEPRIFCGFTLHPFSASRQKYYKRILDALGRAGGTASEVTFSFAFVCSLPMEQLRKVARGFDSYEAAFDEWIEALPSPVPPAEIQQLSILVEEEIRKLTAAQFEIFKKAGEENSREAPPPNS